MFVQQNCHAKMMVIPTLRTVPHAGVLMDGVVPCVIRLLDLQVSFNPQLNNYSTKKIMEKFTHFFSVIK